MAKAVLLDIDGTLVLSNEAHARAWSEALARHGYDIPAGRITPLIGLGSDKLLTRLVPKLSSDHGVGKQIADARAQIFMEKCAHNLNPAPGGRQLVQRIVAKDKNPVIATSAKRDELQLLMRAAEIDDLIEDQTSSEDVEGSKPEPDVVLSALEKAGTEPEETVMIGDTPYDVEAAGRAGVSCIALRCGGHDLDLADASVVYDDPADLLAHYEESPLAR